MQWASYLLRRRSALAEGAILRRSTSLRDLKFRRNFIGRTCWTTELMVTKIDNGFTGLIGGPGRHVRGEATVQTLKWHTLCRLFLPLINNKKTYVHVIIMLWSSLLCNQFNIIYENPFNNRNNGNGRQKWYTLYTNWSHMEQLLPKLSVFIRYSMYYFFGLF